MSFGSADLARIDAAQEVEIETQAPGGSAHRTIIWAVVDDAEVLIRSYRGATARWYRERFRPRASDPATRSRP